MVLLHKIKFKFMKSRSPYQLRKQHNNNEQSWYWLLAIGFYTGTKEIHVLEKTQWVWPQKWKGLQFVKQKDRYVPWIPYTLIVILELCHLFIERNTWSIVHFEHKAQKP
jgi:hypothetical protein